MKTTRSDRASQTVANIAVLGVSLVALAPVIPAYWGSSIEMASERPLLRRDVMVATADTEVVCLSRETGQVFWRRRIGGDPFARIRAAALRGVRGAIHPELPGQTIIRDADSLIAVVGLGFGRDRSRVSGTDPPWLALLDPKDGATLRRSRIGREQAVRDYHRVPGGHLVLTDDHLLLLDDALAVRDTLVPPAGHRNLVEFIPADSALLIRTNAGAYELDPHSLAIRWERNLGGGVETAVPTPPDTRIWMIGHRALLGHSITGTRSQVWIPLDAAVDAITGRTALALLDRSVEIIPLPADGP